MIELTLPYPISANRYWRPVRIGERITIVPTKEAKAYKQQVGWILKAQGVREALPGRVQVHVQMFPHRPLDYKKRVAKDPMHWDDTVQRLDLDNARKVVYDALREHAFKDDFFIFKDSAEVMEPDGREACLVVTIQPYARMVNPQGDLLGACA